jgi:hypothetical protein
VARYRLAGWRHSLCKVFAKTEGEGKQTRFRNTKVLTVRDGKIAEIKVYFGWNVPLKVPAGKHSDPKLGCRRADD